MINKITSKLLESKEKMPVNELCWCKSGLKWKKCHRNRELQNPVPMGKIIAQLNRELDVGYCLHPEANANTCNRTINSHTVQRNGGLAVITEKGHVISPKKGFREIYKNDGKTTPQLFGVKKATTFRGFCGLHDNEMFEKVEQEIIITINNETAFILSFRAFCYEYLLKESAIRVYNEQKVMDKGQPFETQVTIQQYLYMQFQGLEIGMKYMNKWRSKYDSIYLSKRYKDFKFYTVEFNGLLPMVASGAFNPEFDCSGQRIQYLTEETDLLDVICFNITSFMGNSILILGWLPTKNNKSQLFVQSLMKVKNKANVAMYIAIEQLENIYFKPSWWDTLSKREVVEIEKRFASGIGTTRTERAYTNLPFELANLTSS